jgi:siroheme synthase
MGLANLPEISAQLIAAGLPASTRAAAIENGTTGNQRVCETTLAGLPDAITTVNFGAPVLVIIGRVVEAMAWMNQSDDSGVTDGLASHG